MDKKDIPKYIDYIYKNIYDITKEIFESSYYKKMVLNLGKEKKKYIEARNKAFIDKKLLDFINKNKEITVLTPPIIYYGDNNNN